MAIRYVDIEPDDGKAKAVKAAPKPVPAPSSTDKATDKAAADAVPAPAGKPKRRKK